MIRTLAICTAIAVSGAVPLVSIAPAHADGPVYSHSQGKAPKKKAHKKRKAKPARARTPKVVFSGNGPATPLRPGGTYSWPYALTNSGPVRASSVSFSAPLPASLEFVSAQGDCSWKGNAVTCQVGSLAPAQTMTGIITAKVATAAAAGTAISSPALVRWSGSQSTGAFPKATVAAAADLVVSKSGPAVVRPGETASYEIIVRNAGPSAARDIVLTDVTHPAKTSRSVPLAITKADRTCKVSGSEVVCDLGTMEAGDSQTIGLQVKVGPEARPDTAFEGPSQVVTPTYDINLANNRAGVVTEVRAPFLARAAGTSLSRLPATGAPTQMLIDFALGLLGLGLVLLRLGRHRPTRKYVL